ncbi:MAG: hypothetical protein OWU84_09750 [Firmicutes bacterium]|nr:hypothetical protein [Bacillota bacterium]
MGMAWGAVGLSALMWLGVPTTPRSSAAMLVSALTAAGTKMSQGSVSDWVSVEQPTSLGRLLSEVARQLGVRAPIHAWRGYGYDGLSERGRVGGGEVQVLVERVAPDNPDIVVTETWNRVGWGFPVREAALARTLCRYGMLHQEVTVAGVWTRVLTPHEEAKAIEGVWRALRGRPLSESVGRRAVVEFGRTPDVSATTRWAQKRVNVQLVVSLHRRAHETVLYLGSPLVTIPYEV